MVGGLYYGWLWCVWWCGFVMVVFCVCGFWGGYWFGCFGVVVLCVWCSGWCISCSVVCCVVLVGWVVVCGVGLFGCVIGFYVSWVGVWGGIVVNVFDKLLFEMC